MQKVIPTPKEILAVQKKHILCPRTGHSCCNPNGCRCTREAAEAKQ